MALKSRFFVAQMTDPVDRLYAESLSNITPFRFDAAVVNVFPDMIKRSVPGYSTIVQMTGQLARQFVTTGSHIYDFGSSLGANTLAIRHALKTDLNTIVAIDNSQAMVDQCLRIINADALDIPVKVLCEDIRQVPIENASFSVLNFTLQFVPLADRLPFLRRIYEGTRPGGALILSEKICFEDPGHDALMIDLHHHFKRSNGYSDLEIAQKRASLESVLVPETLKMHKHRLLEAGFTSVDSWFQCFNFASLIAIK